MQCSVCVINRLLYNQPCWCSWTVTVIIKLWIPPRLLMTSCIPLPTHHHGHTTMAYGHKFSALRPVSQRLLDRSKNTSFYVPHLYLASHWGWYHRNFVEIFSVVKISCGLLFEILHLAILIQYRVMTDRRTRDDSKYCASIASCG